MENNITIMKKHIEVTGAANWRPLTDKAESAAWNMAADEAMLMSHAAEETPPTLRFYAWDPAAVSLGYFQRADAEIDRDACTKMGIDVVRRLTGGRAVLHDLEVTYSLVVNEAEPYIPSGVTASYLFFSRGIAAGLAQLGIDAQMQAPGAVGASPGGRGLRSAACFDAPSYYELTVGGRKVVGSAQLRKDGVLLQHGSILLNFEPERMVNILRLSDKVERTVLLQELPQRATGLSEVKGRKVRFAEVASAVAAGIAYQCGLKLTSGERTPAEINRTQELADRKYSTEEWNLRR